MRSMVEGTRHKRRLSPRVPSVSRFASATSPFRGGLLRPQPSPRQPGKLAQQGPRIARVDDVLDIEALG